MDFPGLESVPVIAISLISLSLIIAVHIVVISRWSGRVDASLEAILRQPSQWQRDMTTTASAIRAEIAGGIAGLKAEQNILAEEVKKLRESRHVIDGSVQRHEGAIRSIESLLRERER